MFVFKNSMVMLLFCTYFSFKSGDFIITCTFLKKTGFGSNFFFKPNSYIFFSLFSIQWRGINDSNDTIITTIITCCIIRGRSDKCVASPLEDATITREIYYRRRLLLVDGYCQHFSRIGPVVLFWRVEASVSADFTKMEKEQYRWCVDHILHEILGMRKMSARWVSRLLTPDNKRNRETTSEQCLSLTLFKRNPKEFLRRFVTVDETWIHWYRPRQ